MQYPQCNHIMSDGMKCKSPALKRQSYCYFHHRYNQRQRRRVQLGGPVGTNQNTGIEMPVIESWETIQIAIQEILESIIDSRVDPKRAGLMLYALQLASTNLKMMKYPGISQPNGVTELPEDMEEQETFGAPEPLGACRYSRRCTRVRAADGRVVVEATMGTSVVVVGGPGSQVAVTFLRVGPVFSVNPFAH